ncbi:MAG: hypothetical protein H6739_42365 [Alphaproteobacteria bacterium]|nr:hypothetical protein [Alphaproteobacteria bacterium]
MKAVVGFAFLEQLPGPAAALAVGAAADRSIWVVGEDGLAARRLRPGHPWAVLDTGSAADLHAVSALSRTEAWAVGDGGTVLLWHGDRWSPVELPGRRRVDLLDVAFATPTLGAVGGTNGALYATTDGGGRWARLGRSGEADVTALAVTGAGVVVAGRADGSVLIATLEEDGQRWTERALQVPGGAGLRDLYAVDAASLLALDGAGEVWCTRDGGDLWTPLGLDAADAPVQAVIRGPLGITAVHADGELTVVKLRRDGVSLHPVPVDPQARGSAAFEVRQAAASGEQLLAATADGQVMSQGVRRWMPPTADY